MAHLRLMLRIEVRVCEEEKEEGGGSDSFKEVTDRLKSKHQGEMGF